MTGVLGVPPAAPMHANVFSSKSRESRSVAFSRIASRKRIAAVLDELSRLGGFLAGLGQFDIWKAAEAHVAASAIHSETVDPFLCATVTAASQLIESDWGFTNHGRCDSNCLPEEEAGRHVKGSFP